MGVSKKTYVCNLFDWCILKVRHPGLWLWSQIFENWWTSNEDCDFKARMVGQTGKGHESHVEHMFTAD